MDCTFITIFISGLLPCQVFLLLFCGLEHTSTNIEILQVRLLQGKNNSFPSITYFNLGYYHLFSTHCLLLILMLSHAMQKYFSIRIILTLARYQHIWTVLFRLNSKRCFCVTTSINQEWFVIQTIIRYIPAHPNLAFTEFGNFYIINFFISTQINFKTAAIDHSANSPKKMKLILNSLTIIININFQPLTCTLTDIITIQVF